MKTDNYFFETASQLDALIALASPTEEERDKLFRLLKTESTERYFFRHLAASKNLSWLPFLREKGYFSVPPTWADVGGISAYPQWHALSYLDAIISELPSEVIEIAENFQLENARVVLVFVGSFLKVPAEYAPKISSLILKWLNSGLSVDKDLIALIHYWVGHNQWKAALAIVDVILTPQKEPASEELRNNPYYSPRAKFRQYDYYVEEFLKLRLPEYLAYRCSDILSILEQKIIQALSIEQAEQSSYWRSSIELSSQSVQDNCKDLLLNAAIEAIQALLSQEHENAIPTIDRYLEHPYPIFRRLAIHTIRENQQLWTRYLDQIYSNPKYLDDDACYHEYWLLIRHTFSALSPEKREEYLAQLNEVAATERHRVYRYLWAIKDDLSGTKAQPVFDELRKEFGDPNPPDSIAFLMYSSEASFGWVSAKSAVELVQLSPDTVLAELKKPYPSWRASFDEATREGLATELSKAIKEKPSQFASIAPDLVGDDIHPMYAAHAITGFREAWKEKKDFDWEPVVKLCHRVLQEREELPPSDTPIDLRPGYWDETYSGARSVIVDLLSAAVVNDNNAIPKRFLVDVRTILLCLADDDNPSAEYEAEWGTAKGMDYLNLSLNVVRSKAVAALIQYALHLARINDRDEAHANTISPQTRLEPEVRQKLTEKLNKELDPSKTVHLNFGLYLPNLHYLDSAWVLKHLDDIFPLSPKKIEYWRAAWNGYIFRDKFYGELYPVLKKYYAYAIQQLENDQHPAEGIRDSSPRLAGHLAMLYGHGEESLDSKESLVAKFLEVASDDLVAWFVQMLSPGRAQEPFNAGSDDWQRRKKFWHQRYAFIQSGENIQNHSRELSAYLWWVPHIPDPLVSYYEMIEVSALVAEDHQLINLFKDLVQNISDNLRFVVILYEKIYQAKGSRYLWFADRDEVQIILETAMRSNDPVAKQSAIRTINIYGERGDERYRPLLDEA